VERNGHGIEEYLVSGTFVLNMELVQGRYVRKLSIEKMRSTALEPAQYIFKIIQDRGIVLQCTGAAAG
jgi:KaiC/GvpD/RAD55 family RecA-like ATPase